MSSNRTTDEEQRRDILRRPLSVQETGLSMALLTELALKIIYNTSELTAGEISRALCLPFAGVVWPVLELLDREELASIVGAEGFGEQAFRYAVTRKGIEWFHQMMERNRYIGPAPVPLERYNAMIRAQAVREVVLNDGDLLGAFEGLVVNASMVDKIGPALMSGQSVFLYGAPGNGKTTIAGRMARLLATDPIYIPYAVSVDNHIIKVYDDFNHVRVTEQPRGAQPVGWGNVGQPAVDERWVMIDRPNIMVGGELNLESLNLIWDPSVKYYEAPLQMKANGGMFLIDDFGRQQMDPQDLLNRWTIPLETRVDFLSLHTGRKIEIPFEALVVFSTNLDPTDLVDEAFLRRIRHKIKVGDPTLLEFRQVFQGVCRTQSVDFSEEGFDHFVREWYTRPQRGFRYCHPRDIVDQLLDLARYKRLRPVATPQMLDQAGSAYFVDL